MLQGLTLGTPCGWRSALQEDRPVLPAQPCAPPALHTLPGGTRERLLGFLGPGGQGALLTICSCGNSAGRGRGQNRIELGSEP